MPPAAAEAATRRDEGRLIPHQLVLAKIKGGFGSKDEQHDGEGKDGASYRYQSNAGDADPKMCTDADQEQDGGEVHDSPWV